MEYPIYVPCVFLFMVLVSVNETNFIVMWEYLIFYKFTTLKYRSLYQVTKY